MKKSTLVLIVIAISSILSSYILIETYNSGYFTFFLVSIILLLTVFALNYLSKRKLSFNILSISLIIAYLLNTLGFIITTSDAIFLKIFPNIILISAISIELTSEYISSGMIYRQIKGFLLQFVYRLIGLIEFARMFRVSKLQVTNSKKIALVSLFLFFIVGLPIVIFVLILLASSSNQFSQILTDLINLDNISIEINIFRFILAIIISLYLATEYIFIKKLSEVNFKNSEISTSEVVKKYIVYVSQITISILNLFYIVFIYIQLKYDFNNLWAYIQENNITTFSSLAVTRFTELLIVSFINLSIIYFVSRPIIKISFSSIFTKIIKFNSLFLGISTLALIYSVHTRLSMYESGYGFTVLRLNSHIFLITLVVATICLVLPIIIGKEMKRVYQIAISSFIIFFGIILAIPTVYVSNKINFEMYKAGTFRTFDIGYSTNDRVYQGGDSDALWGAQNTLYSNDISLSSADDDGILVLIEYLKYIEEKNIQTYNYKIISAVKEVLKGKIEGIEHKQKSEHIVNRDYNLMYQIILGTYKKN
ncbi:MAG: DUF4153 domain-containing protein [bacterium]